MTNYIRVLIFFTKHNSMRALKVNIKNVILPFPVYMYDYYNGMYIGHPVPRTISNWHNPILLYE